MKLKLRLRGLDLEPLPLSFVAVLFRRVRTTAESLPQEVCLHTTGEEDQLSQDFAACHTLKVPREAGVLAFPDRILVGAKVRGQRCLLPRLGLTASGKEFAFHGWLSSTTFIFTGRLSSTTGSFTGTLSSTTFAFALAFLGLLPGITHLQLLLEGGAVVLVLPDLAPCAHRWW